MFRLCHYSEIHHLRNTNITFSPIFVNVQPHEAAQNGIKTLHRLYEMFCK